MVVLDHEKFLTLKTIMVVNNNSGKDKQATVNFEFLKDDDEKAVASTTLKNAKVGAGDTELKEIKIPVTPELMPVGFKMFGPNKDVPKHAVRLRLTLTVVDY